MSTLELMELALLDVLALLDDEEREEFDRAFRTATPEVQAQIRREQTRLARIESLLPDTEPPVNLRPRVLAAVRAAMNAATSPGEAAALHLAQTSGRPPAPRAAGHRRRVTAWWRATALGSAAAAIVFAVLLFQLRADYERLGDDLKRDALLSQLIETFGSRYVTDAIFDADTHRVAFRPEAVGMQGRAAVWHHPDWDAARFFVVDLPPSDTATYQLVVLDSQGNIVQNVAEFRFTGGLLHRDIPIQIAVTGSQLGVVATAPGEHEGRIVLSSEVGLPPS